MQFSASFHYFTNIWLACHRWFTAHDHHAGADRRRFFSICTSKMVMRSKPKTICRWYVTVTWLNLDLRGKYDCFASKLPKWKKIIMEQPLGIQTWFFLFWRMIYVENTQKVWFWGGLNYIWLYSSVLSNSYLNTPSFK